jgi:hypothetical protein
LPECLIAFSPENMTSEYDLRYLRAGIDLLESYLLSQDIYRSLGVAPPAGEPPYPQLTLGWLLLSCRRLQASAVTPAQRDEAARLGAGLDATRTHWRVAWGNKARAEFRARLNLWRDFLDEYRAQPEANYDRYGYEVSRRVLLELLQPEAEGQEQADLDMLGGLDGLLKALFRPGEFVWDADLARAFPAGIYWFLYGALPKHWP